jgi:UDP-3-O-[3-hydroxymyristoyl] N-acetylglucosamine deacetylase
VGAYIAEKSGHALNNALLRALFADPSSYEIKSFDEASAPQAYQLKNKPLFA